MVQEMFPKNFPQLPLAAKAASAAAAAGFVGVISLFNLLGRFFWASSSDYVGRKTTVAIFLGLNAVMFWLIPIAGQAGNLLFFVAICAVILSIYGGGFSTSPAYLKDLFGTKNFGPIYGRLLTAWATAGVVGPLIVNHIRLDKVQATRHRREPLRRHHASDGGPARGGVRRQPVRAPGHCGKSRSATRRGHCLILSTSPFSSMSDYPVSGSANTPPASPATNTSAPLVAIYWLIVLVPLGWGVYQTVQKSVPSLSRRGYDRRRQDRCVADADDQPAYRGGGCPARQSSDFGHYVTVPATTPATAAGLHAVAQVYSYQSFQMGPFYGLSD